ncbi:DNA oxidative demethylase AlkB [Marinobacter salinisoli]|uniref:DNA oxidative demethylase AlkB n=1 Tax=Marinobacter salinisoli TaxID=2769486 RepID=A0ABX7MMC5_9GAMM|nr:DNA oxidative demethylase AlkB [Marinobacter salinisoli]QSP93355.1 DNA oxidative demethylase AlkB [Marinobacter salinisoli]
MTMDLFQNQPVARFTEEVGEGARVLRGLACDSDQALLNAITRVARQAPFRHMQTPSGHTMSAAMTCCGQLGWVTDARGYRYQQEDPLSGELWPAIPEPMLGLAQEAAAEAGYPDFRPDACLINRYQPGAKMGLHQDKDEQDFGQPIVSVSLGLPQVFQFGGARRNERPVNIPLGHGDVVVWGGPSRLFYHGVLRLKEGEHPLTGRCRYNLTFRRAR